MDGKTAIFTGLSVLAILIVFYGIASLAFYELSRFGLPSQANTIVFGLLMFVFVLLLARMFQKE